MNVMSDFDWFIPNFMRVSGKNEAILAKIIGMLLSKYVCTSTGGSTIQLSDARR